jgi:hypothetical protein
MRKGTAQWRAEEIGMLAISVSRQVHRQLWSNNIQRSRHFAAATTDAASDPSE